MSSNKDETGLRVHELKQEMVRVVALNYDCNWGKISFLNTLLNQFDYCVSRTTFSIYLYSSIRFNRCLTSFYFLRYFLTVFFSGVSRKIHEKRKFTKNKNLTKINLLTNLKFKQRQSRLSKTRSKIFDHIFGSLALKLEQFNHMFQEVLKPICPSSYLYLQVNLCILLDRIGWRIAFNH